MHEGIKEEEQKIRKKREENRKVNPKPRVWK